MCGIFGYVLSSARPDTLPALGRVIDALSHRGPDGHGTFVDHRTDPICALAHTRLAVIDLSPSGQQPMSSPDGRLTITFNGEIYNYRDIRAELERLGERFVTASDTEVLILGYRRWGPEFVSRLRGMFAFAIWDALDRTMFLARDPLGVKPLYVAPLPNGALFASEVRALLGTDLVRRSVSRTGLCSYLAFGSVREPETLIDGIVMLPAGSYAYLRPGRLQTMVYWTPPIGVDRTISRSDAVMQVGELLRESVALRLVSDRRIGVFLSGGLDSSVVLARAAAASPRPIDAFTVTFDESDYDETRFAKEIATRFGATHHPIRLSAKRALDEVDDALGALDQPSGDGLNTYFVSKAVRAAGVAVALSGIGGDEIFGGYAGLRRFVAAQRLAPALRRLPSLRSLTSSAIVSTRLGKGLWLLGTRGDPFALYSVLRSMFLPRDYGRLLGLRGIGHMEPTGFDSQIAAWASSRDGDSGVSYGLFDLTNYLRNTLLRDTDVMGMAHGLEIREPLLDHRLVERALTIPGHMQRAANRNKPLLADAAPEVPRVVARRSKMGFTLPLETWLRGPLRSWALERLGESDLLDAPEVKRLWLSFERGHLSYSRIWTVLALFNWARRHGVSLATAR